MSDGNFSPEDTGASRALDVNPIVHGRSEVALKHGGKFTPRPPHPLVKIQTTKAVDLKLGTRIK